MNNILVIVAHPDDETLSCGGALAKHVACGDNVTCLVMTDNYRSPNISGHFGEAMQVLKVQNYRLLGMPDMKLETFTLWELSERIEDVVKEIGAPDIVYTHCKNDLSQDHRLTFLAAMTALRPVWDKAFSIYSFESPSSTEWSGVPFNANLFIDINGYLKQKLEAIDCYCTEVRPFPHPRSQESLTARAIYWGSYCGVEYAEAFEVVREVR